MVAPVTGQPFLNQSSPTCMRVLLTVDVAVMCRLQAVSAAVMSSQCFDDINCCRRHLPQSACVRAPVFLVTRLVPQLMLLPLLVGFSALSPPGQ